MSAFHEAEADRRISQIVQIGVVTSVSGGHAAMRVGDIETIALPVGSVAMGAMRIKTMPSIGEQRLVFAPGGDMARAVVGPAVAASNMPGGANEDAVIDLGGGELHIVADIKVEGGIETTGDVVADGVSLISHVHDGVATGNSTTKKPVK